MTRPIHYVRLCMVQSVLPLSLVVTICFTPNALAQTSPSEIASGNAKELDRFYQLDQVQAIHLEVSEKNLSKMKAALPKRIYVPATFRCRGRTIEKVGVRYKGNSSSQPRQQHKRSFLIKFNEYEKGQTFLGLQRVALDNGVQFGSLFSEPIITSILRDLDLKASRCNHAQLYLNGKFHGVYVNVERIDTVFTRNHFADGGGPLYKNDVGGAGANLGPVPADSARRGPRGLAFEPKSPAAWKDARDVLELIEKINGTDPKRFAEVIDSAIELDAFLKTMAVMLFSGAFDQLTGLGPHNFYLYHDPQTDRWNYLPWDLDVGFADNAFRRVPVISGWNAAWPTLGESPSPIVERIVRDPQLLARYRKVADEILEKHFHPDVLIPRFSAVFERIKKDLDRDPFPKRRATNPEDKSYDTIIASIHAFVRKRYETARTQLDNPGERPNPAQLAQRREQGPQPGRPSADAPTELRVTSSAGSVTLSWKDNTRGEVAHIVQRADGPDGVNFRNHIGKPGPNVTTATDTAVATGRIFRYRVYAVRPTPMGPAGTGVSNVVTVKVESKRVDDDRDANDGSGMR